MPKLYPAIVTVTFDDGKPLDQATVMFHLKDPVLSKTWVHAGVTDAEGKAKLMTQGEYEGIPAGKYSVTVEKFINEGEAMEEDAAPSPEKRFSTGTSKVLKRYQLVEEAYLDHLKTPLKDIEVKTGKNDIVLKAGKEQRIYKPIRPAM